MKTIQVFDPSTCSGGCGCGHGDPAAAEFAADVKWATRMGARIERASLAEQPAAFTGNPVVKSFVERSGLEALPLVLVDGEVAMAGRYPSRGEIARWAGLDAVLADAGNCCSGGRCAG